MREQDRRAPGSDPRDKRVVKVGGWEWWLMRRSRPHREIAELDQAVHDFKAALWDAVEPPLRWLAEHPRVVWGVLIADVVVLALAIAFGWA